MLKNYVAISVKKLVKAKWNYKEDDAEKLGKLVANIKKNGQIENLIVRELPKGTFEIVNGNHRYDAMLELKQEDAVCYNLGKITLGTAKRIAIETNETRFASNKNLLAERIAELMKEFTLEDLESTMPYTAIEIQSFINVSEVNAEKGAGGGDPDDLPEKVPPRANPGDLVEMGKHRLLCGDSTNLQHIERLMGGAKADMVWTDPPYNVAYEGKTKAALKIDNDSMGDAKFLQFLTDAFVGFQVVTKPGGAIYIAHADSEGFNFRAAMIKAQWLMKQCLIWKKQTLVMGRQDYHWIHEPILYGWKAGAAHKWCSDRKQTTILEFDRPQRNAEHPTMKPVELVEYMILNNSDPADIVLDGFGGSGTTIIACEKNGRRGYSLELDPTYCDVIVERWMKYTGKMAYLINDGERVAWDTLEVNKKAKPKPKK